MAWQLIYTSAPRSLDAGRSGFGTVARHRAISPLLAAAIERFSQFSRLPGTDTGRVIYSYRTVQIAANLFHVLSAIRDAGVDYTGRTNHIAHHLIAEPKEIALLGTAGPSPADVLLAMNWLTSWNELPRFLENAEEISLDGVGNQTNGSAWTAIAGSPNQAWLLAGGDASRGAYVVHPDELDLRAPFAEALHLIPDRLWRITFTTSLQPSDESTDFRWIGIDEHSPLRDKAASSGRPILDLLTPSMLPLVEVVQQTEAAPIIPNTPPPVTGPASPPAESSTPSRAPKLAPLWASSQVDPEFAALSDSGRPSRHDAADIIGPRKAWPLSWILSAIAAIVVAILWFALYVPWQHKRDEELRERKEIVEAIMETVSSTTAGANPLTPSNAAWQQWYQLPLSDLRTLRHLAELTTEMIKAMESADFQKIIVAEDAYTTARDTASKSSIPVPPAFDEIQDRLHKSIALHAGFAAQAPPKAEDYATFQEIQERARNVKELDARSAPHAKKLQEQLRETATNQEADALLALLNGSGQMEPNRPEGVNWFRDALNHGEERAPTGLQKRFEPVRSLLDDWKFTDETETADALPKLEERLRQRPKWPDWLKAKAQAKITASRRGNAPAENKATPGQTVNATPNKQLGKLPNAPRPKLYFVESTEKLSSLSIKELVPELDFELRSPGGEVTKLIQVNKASGTVRKNYQTDKDGFQIDNGKLKPESAAPPGPFVLIGRNTTDGGTEVLRVYVGFPLEKEVLFPAPPTLKLEGETLKITGEFPNFAPSLEPSFAIVMPPESVAHEMPTELPMNDRGECDLKPVLTELRGLITNTRKKAIRLSKEASENGASGRSLEALRAKVKDLAGNIKSETARKEIQLDAKTPAELVGDYAKALAIEWNGQPRSGGKGDDSKDGPFEVLREAGFNLGQAMGNVEKAREKNAQLLEITMVLEKKHHTADKEEGLREVRRLCDSLAAQLGDAKSLEAETARSQSAAEILERRAKELEALPLNRGDLPTGEYTVVAKLKGTSEVKLFTFAIPSKP